MNSSIVGRIVEFFEIIVRASVPSLSPSSNYYNFENNPSTRDGRVFAVRPGRASVIDGPTKVLTFNQEFELEISRDYFTNEANDTELRDAVDEIYKDNEKIMKELSFQRTDEIINILPPSFDAPKVNDNGRSVSIVFNYQIIYRKSVKGV